MAIVSEAQLLSCCLARGLKRRDAVTLAHIAYFEQMDGGIEIGGIVWRYRTVAEIGTAKGYSVRQITRALASLDEQDLIERKVIWDPRKHGPYRVNGYRLTKSALRMLEGASTARKPERPDRKRRGGGIELAVMSLSEAPNRPDRQRHKGVNMYRGQGNEQGTELFTLQRAQEERVFQFLGGEKPERRSSQEYFDAYVRMVDSHGDSLPRAIEVFWASLEEAVSIERGQSVEPLDLEVSRRVGNYLQLLKKKQYAWVSPVEHGAIALWAYLNWHAFAGMVGTLRGKWPDGERMNSWHLAKHSMLVIDHLAQAKKDHDEEKTNVSSWLSGPL